MIVVQTGLRAVKSQASRGFVSEPQCDEYFSGSSSRGMTVYSPAFPFSLGLSLCRNVSISSPLCWFVVLVLVTCWDAWLGPFHLSLVAMATKIITSTARPTIKPTMMIQPGVPKDEVFDYL
ncbi:hypothetical protein T07_10721 [Trichinella nelsoni]|uniref:Uncharacterized protein n=1 Tax=Trichinella nelsoni TaxID=6336 RepID=A0A0V0RCU5_9BILA|nr:hypothetical protein T07_10721 [Trichinella nelsoni]